MNQHAIIAREFARLHVFDVAAVLGCVHGAHRAARVVLGTAYAALDPRVARRSHPASACTAVTTTPASRDRVCRRRAISP